MFKRYVVMMGQILAMIVLTITMSAGIVMGMGAAPKIPDIRIEEAKAFLSPMMPNTASVFMKITNTGKGGDNLIGASVDMPNAMVELHDFKDEKMVAIEKVSIPSEGVVELKPKSLHIMIFKMPKDIKAESEITLKLKFEKSGEKTLKVKLMKPSPEMPMHKH